LASSREFKWNRLQPVGLGLAGSDPHRLKPVPLPPGRKRTRRWLVLIAEGQSKFPRNFRPEFPELVKSNIHRYISGNILGRGPHAATLPGVIQVADGRCAYFSEPFGKVKHGSAMVIVCDHGVRHGMQETPPFRAITHSVVARILRKKSWVSELLEKSELNLIDITDAQPFGISHPSLAKGRIIILRLRNSRIESSA